MCIQPEQNICIGRKPALLNLEGTVFSMSLICTNIMPFPATLSFTASQVLAENRYDYIVTFFSNLEDTLLYHGATLEDDLTTVADA